MNKVNRINTDHIRKEYPNDPVILEFANEIDFWAPLLSSLDSLHIRDVIGDEEWGLTDMSMTVDHSTNDAIRLNIDGIIKLMSFKPRFSP